MRDVHKYYYADSVAGWSVYYTASLLYRDAVLNYFIPEHNKFFLQMHLLAEAVYSGICVMPEYSHMEFKYHSWIVSLSSIIPSSADKSIRLA